MQALNNFYKLYNNPFILYPLFVEFYKHSKPTDKNILLSYLVLPLVLFSESQSALQKNDKRRSLRTFAKKRESLYGLSERIKEFRDITNLSMQLAFDQQALSLLANEAVFANKPDSSSYLNTKQVIAARNLAKMFENADIISIYRNLGIQSL